MSCVDDQPPPNFKHYCRVCKKGFMCGRALGGHMRAHGIGDENTNLDDEDDRVSDWDEKFGGGGGSDNRTSNKRMYQLRTNPNRLKSTRTCENCGKEFLSWKSFLEHGKCSSDDASESLISSPESEGEDEGGGATGGRQGGGGWSKRKRSLRSKVGCLNSTYPPFGEDDDDDLLLARCLIQLANTTVDPLSVEPEESCASASREAEERRNHNAYFTSPKNRVGPFDHKAKGVISSSKGLFECKACKKVFNSHQALGGHRASHKKVKGCYAAKQDQIIIDHDVNNVSSLAVEDSNDMVTNDQDFLMPSKSTSSYQFEQGPALVGAARRKSKVHECSICHRVFNSGQALGGHKRCHWITSNISPDTSSLPKFNSIDQPIHHHHHQNQLNKNSMVDNTPDKLDLNVPAWVHMSGLRRDPQNPLSFEVSTDMHLQPWITGQASKEMNGPDEKFHVKNDEDDNKKNHSDDNMSNKVVVKSNGDSYVDDEADSKSLKLAKLSELKDMDTSVSSSQWLQVGIGSTTETAAAADA